MKLEIIEQNLYKKSIKKLSKKYKNIFSDIDEFLNSITSVKDLGVHLGDNVYKARIKNSNKNKGKSAGYSLISYLKIVNNELHLIYIYDKSQISNLTEKEIDELVISQIKEFNQ